MAIILLAEDDKALGKAYSLILKRAGHDVTHSVNGVEALKKLETIVPDVILLDMLMPKMGGIGFLKAFDAHKHPEVKVVVLSNFDDADGIQQALDLGATKYLLKASTAPSALIDIVDGLLK